MSDEKEQPPKDQQPGAEQRIREGAVRPTEPPPKAEPKPGDFPDLGGQVD